MGSLLFLTIMIVCESAIISKVSLNKIFKKERKNKRKERSKHFKWMICAPEELEEVI